MSSERGRSPNASKECRRAPPVNGERSRIVDFIPAFAL
jgi:hypothetical protein